MIDEKNEEDRKRLGCDLVGEGRRVKERRTKNISSAKKDRRKTIRRKGPRRHLDKDRRKLETK